MSREQAEGEGATEASDVYSLALTLYECWAGDNPVAAGTPAATARRIGSDLPSLANRRPDLPEALIAAVDDALRPDAAERPGVDELAEVLEWTAEELDDEHCLPGREGARAEREPWRPATAGLAVLTAAGLALALLAGPAGLGGLALVLGVLMLPAVVVASPFPRVALPPLAAPFAAVSLAPAFPALVASGRAGSERAALAALGWFWTAAASIAVGAGTLMPFADRAPHAWVHSASAAASGVLAPLLDPVSLAAAALFAIAGLAIGPIVRTHLSLALLGALLWGAALDGGLRLIGLAALSPSPLVPAGAAVAAALIASGAAPRTSTGPLAAAGGRS
jgi:serine/threonine-protein kinase